MKRPARQTGQTPGNTSLSVEVLASTLSGFSWLASRGRWKPARHLRLLADRLHRVASGEIDRLLISMPPRHGKSSLISQYFPAWYLAMQPDKRVLLTSYEADFAAGWGWRARNVFNEIVTPLFGLRIDQTSSARNRWDLEPPYRGGMQTAGAGGSITGKGADILIIDDPVKNAEEATSRTYQEKTWEWYRSTAYTRLEPGGRVVIVMTRWSRNDLAGKLLQQEPGRWTVISLPAIATRDEAWEFPGGTFRRKQGDPLWPERFPLERLLEIKRAIGGFWWNALYMGEPQPEGGSIFRRAWFRYFTISQDGDRLILQDTPGSGGAVPRSECWVFQTVDPAATAGERSDYFVVSTFAVSPRGDLFLLDVFREQAETTSHMQILRSQYDRWQPDFIAVEAQSFGLNIIQAAGAQGLPVRPVKADRDKVSRARVVSARYESGRVFHRLGARWLDQVEDELLAFPSGEHDDVVDTIAYAGIILAEEQAQDGGAPGFFVPRAY